MTSPAKSSRELKGLHFYLNQEGKLLVWTKIYAAPSGFEQFAPYLAGITQLRSGEKITTQIVDCEESELKTNQPVQIVIRKLGKARPDEIIEYGIKVKPV